MSLSPLILGLTAPSVQPVSLSESIIPLSESPKKIELDNVLSDERIQQFLSSSLFNDEDNVIPDDIESFGPPKSDDILNRTVAALESSDVSSVKSVREPKFRHPDPLPINFHGSASETFLAFAFPDPSINELPIERESSYSSYGAPDEPIEAEEEVIAEVTTVSPTTTAVAVEETNKDVSPLDYIGKGTIVLNVLFWMFLKGSSIVAAGKRRKRSSNFEDNNVFNNDHVIQHLNVRQDVAACSLVALCELMSKEQSLKSPHLRVLLQNLRAEAVGIMSTTHNFCLDEYPSCPVPSTDIIHALVAGMDAGLKGNEEQNFQRFLNDNKLKYSSYF